MPENYHVILILPSSFFLSKPNITIRNLKSFYKVAEDEMETRAALASKSASTFAKRGT